MKNTPLILSVVALVAVAALGIIQFTSGNKTNAAAPAEGVETTAQKGSIVYFNLDRVLNEYDMANELRSAVESKINSINQEVNRRGNKLQGEVNDFQEKINKGLITRSVAEIQGEQLGKKQQDFQNYAAQKQQEINEEQSVMMNQIGDAIKKFVDRFTAEKQYAMVIATQGDILPAPIVSGDASLDVTDAILGGLNDEYVKNKASKSSDK